jgi:hypothetical protein
MRPAKSDFATQDEWLHALASWNEEMPTDENKKMFMVFSKEVTAENFLFDGELWNFQDSFFNADSWDEIVVWAKDEDNILILEGSYEYDAANELLDLAEIEAPDDSAIGGKTFGGGAFGKDSWLNS